jgi:general secretion pathway protein H
MAQRSSSESGYTLIELMVVLAVLSLAALIILPSAAQLFERPRSDEAVRQAVGVLREAKASAITAFRPVRVTAWNEGKWLRIDEREFSLPLGAVAEVSGPGGGSNGGIVFFPDGRSSGGTLSLRSGGTLRSLTVDWRTSRIIEGAQ